ncbi:hypothetical protein LCGC14_1136730 [marine sediment metagenome]|uniref:Uncharacterized protein n=1 Tax=marine sediment metagenome TaxID=412755 RepID=A0A0F9LZK3_9ZZZZ
MIMMSQMITVTSIYDDNGNKIAEVAKCACKPWLTWVEVLTGILGALIMLHLMVI